MPISAAITNHTASIFLNPGCSILRPWSASVSIRSDANPTTSAIARSATAVRCASAVGCAGRITFFRGDWIYQLDRTSLSNFSSYYQTYNPNGVVTEDWPLISSGFTQIINRNSLDRPEFPTAGSEFTLTTELVGTVMGGNVDFHKHTLRIDWFTPALWKLVFYTSFQAGYMEGLGKDAKIPYLEYYFMGGDGLSRANPLRGYEDPLSGGTVIAEGGKAMLKYTAELRIPIAPNPTIFGLLFAEAGNTWPDFKRADPFSMKRSVGIGARVYMPMVGIIGFDYGYGFDRVDQNGNPDPKWKMHFVFGRSF